MWNSKKDGPQPLAYCPKCDGPIYEETRHCKDNPRCRWFVCRHPATATSVVVDPATGGHFVRG